MKTVICVFFLAIAAVAFSRPDGTYTTKYDNVNVTEILENDRLLIPHIKCLLDQGRCAPEGKEIKDHIIDALETNCASCNERQKQGTKEVIEHLVNKKNEYWQQLVAKYDPDHKYSTKYEDDLKKVKH